MESFVVRPTARWQIVLALTLGAAGSWTLLGLSGCVDLTRPERNAVGGSGGGPNEQTDAEFPAASGGASGATPLPNPDPVAGLAPPVLSVRWHFDGAALEWTSETRFAQFIVQKRDTEGSAFTSIGEVKGKAKSFTDIGGPDASSFSYVVVGRSDLGHEVRSNVVQFVRGRNLVNNPGFEQGGAPSQPLVGWLTWSPSDSAAGDNADFIADDAPARSGKHFAVHTATSTFTVLSYQKFVGLAPGRYGARGFFSQAAAAASGITIFGLKLCGGPGHGDAAEAPTSPSGWVELAVEFNVEAGLCYEVFVYSEVESGSIVRFDDIGVYRITP